MNDIQDYAQKHAGRLLEQIQELTAIESPSHDRDRVNEAVAWMETRLQAAGAATTRIPHSNAGDQLVARLGGGSDRTLLLGHLDTVWDVGQLARMPTKVEEGKAYGPGIFDMKSGAVIVLDLFRMAAGAVCRPAALVAFFSSDEELGSPTSRPVLEQIAGECNQVLVLEPCLPGGRAKTFRKGVSRYTLEIYGKSAHAGVSPDAGVSAVEEFAHQVFALRELVKPFADATLNIGVVKAGTASNVVPEYLNAEIDVRIASAGDGEAIDGRLKALAPRLPGAALRVSGGINRPPLERTESVVRLFDAAASVAREQGWILQEGATGGGSDGSFTAALGIPTLDGLGPDGNGAHALNEHILIEDLPRRLALLAGLLEKFREW